MSDNVVVTPGTGKTIAADEVADGTLGTASVQYVKLMDGTLDSTSKIASTYNGLNVSVVDAAAPTTGSITAADIASTTNTGFNGSNYYTGTPTAASSVSVAFNGENVVAIQLTGTWVGTVAFERSMDNGTTWSPATTLNNGNPYSSVTGNGQFHVNAAGTSNVRVRCTSFTSGTVSVSLLAGTGMFPVSVVSPLLGQYNATAPTVTSGNNNALQTDVQGNLKSNMAVRLDAVNDAVTTYPLGHSYSNITTNATTTVKTGSGTVVGITINNPSAITVANLTLTLWDSTAASGTKIGTMVVPFGTTGAMPFKIALQAAFSTGLTVQTAGPTVTADITVEYR